MCSISKYGRLLEGGDDPFFETTELACQTNLTYRSPDDVVADYIEPYKTTLSDATADETWKPGQCSQVLRVAVGLLGLEVHEKPASWAEVWLNLKDSVELRVQRGAAAVRAPPSDTDDLVVWQQSVLEHLQQLVARTEQHCAERNRSDPGDPISDGGCGTGGAWGPPHDWGPDFGEHLSLAEYCFRRISHAVRVLGPSSDTGDYPAALRTYTLHMVQDVCTDLRQWLQQLSTIVSLYHVHLLDLDNERRHLSREISESKAREAASARLAKDQANRHDAIKRLWEEDKMRRRAAALMGIDLQSEDAPKYTQHDVDEMKRKWHADLVQPLLDELAELKANSKISRNRKGDSRNKEPLDRQPPRPTRPVTPAETKEEGGIDSANVVFLTAALKRLSERTEENDIGEMLARLAAAVESDGDGLAEILADIGNMRSKTGAVAVPVPSAHDKKVKDPDGPPTVSQKAHDALVQACDYAIPFLEAVTGELGAFEAGIKGSQAGKSLCPLIAWAKEAAAKVKQLISPGADNSGAPPKVPKAPKWDIRSLAPGEKAVVKTTFVQTLAQEGGGDDAAVGAEQRKALEDAIRRQVEQEWNTRFERQRQEHQAEMDAFIKKHEADIKAMQQIIDELELEGKKMKRRLGEMARRIEEMQRLLRARGLGKEIDEAMQQSGLADYLASSQDVFIRLYKDALNRMRRFAEEQARVFQKNQEEYLRLMKDVLTPFTAQTHGANASIPFVSALIEEDQMPAGGRRSSPPRIAGMLSPRRGPTVLHSPEHHRLLEANVGGVFEQLPSTTTIGKSRPGRLLTAPLAPMGANWSTIDADGIFQPLEVKQLGRCNASSPALGTVSRQPPVMQGHWNGTIDSSDAQQVNSEKDGLLPPLSQKQLLVQQIGHQAAKTSESAGLASRRPADKHAGEMKGVAMRAGGTPSKDSHQQQMLVTGIQKGTATAQHQDLGGGMAPPPNVIAAAIAAAAAGARDGSGPHRSMLLPANAGQAGGNAPLSSNSVGAVSGQRLSQQLGGSVSTPHLGRPARLRA